MKQYVLLYLGVYIRLDTIIQLSQAMPIPDSDVVSLNLTSSLGNHYSLICGHGESGLKKLNEIKRMWLESIGDAIIVDVPA